MAFGVLLAHGGERGVGARLVHRGVCSIHAGQVRGGGFVRGQFRGKNHLAEDDCKTSHWEVHCSGQILCEVDLPKAMEFRFAFWWRNFPHKCFYTIWCVRVCVRNSTFITPFPEVRASFSMLSQPGPCCFFFL